MESWMRLLILVVCLLLSYTDAALAAVSTSPKQIVETLYKPYLDDPHAQKLGGPGALDLILPYASQSLKAAIHRNEECERREQGICYIDFDIIINAQDWNLSNFALHEDTKNSLPIINATFINGGKNKVTYFFVREHDDWKIDEIEAIRYNADGTVENGYKLKQGLNAN